MKIDKEGDFMHHLHSFLNHAQISKDKLARVSIIINSRYEYNYEPIIVLAFIENNKIKDYQIYNIVSSSLDDVFMTGEQILRTLVSNWK